MVQNPEGIHRCRLHEGGPDDDAKVQAMVDLKYHGEMDGIPASCTLSTGTQTRSQGKDMFPPEETKQELKSPGSSSEPSSSMETIL